MFQIEDNPLLPYKLKQGYKGYYLGTKVTVESEGERKVPPKPLVLNQNSKTILIVSDSVVFGWGLEDDETIASQLQAVINEKGLSHKVKNFASPSYSTWNEYEAIRQYLEINKADIIIIVFAPNNITFERDSINLQLKIIIKFIPT